MKTGKCKVLILLALLLLLPTGYHVFLGHSDDQLKDYLVAAKIATRLNLTVIFGNDNSSLSCTVVLGYANDSAPIPGKLVGLYLQFDIDSPLPDKGWLFLDDRLIDVNGTAEFAIGLSVMSGLHRLEARFLGDDTFNASSDHVDFIIPFRPTYVNVTSVSRENDTVTVLIRSTRNDGLPCTGRIVAFKELSRLTRTLHTYTNLDGIAPFSFDVADAPNDLYVKVTVWGDSFYAEASIFVHLDLRGSQPSCNVLQAVQHSIRNYVVETYSNATVLPNSTFPSASERAMEYNVSAEAGDGVFMCFKVPKFLLSNVDSVSANGTQLSGLRIEDDGSTLLICFQFPVEGVETVKIAGTWLLLSNIEVANLTSWKILVGADYHVGMNATIINGGLFTETFDLRTAGNGYTINSTRIILAANTSVTTTSVSSFAFRKGSCTVAAYASTVVGETNTTDNSLTLAGLYIGIPGDVAGHQTEESDGKVDMNDIGAICRRFNDCLGEVEWDAKFDINEDSRVDLRDIAVTCVNFGRTQ